MKNIIKIEESFKFPGYCFITCLGKNGQEYSYKRKVYTRKTGKFAGKNLVNLDTEIYSFSWDFAPTSSGLKLGKAWEYIGTYKSIADIDDEPAIPLAKPEEPIAAYDPDAEVKHEKFGIIMACVEGKIPVYLAGPAGSGKNHTLEQIAKELGLEFYFTNSVQQEFKLTGFIDAGGTYHETEFYKAFKDGGLFFLDEMDASIPEVLVLLNAAIANGYFEFPNGKITAHPDFRVVAAGNTVGSGADDEYTGRMVLDQATLDRFAIIEFDYDLKIETHLAKGNMELVQFIRDLRKEAKDNGIRATFSYRCIAMVQKLEGKLTLEQVLLIAVVKGMDKDTINTLKPACGYGDNKYAKALRKIQAAA